MKTTSRALVSLSAAELAARYTYNVTWSWQEQCYVATVAGWDRITAEGPTVKDALREASFLVQATINSHRGLGLAFPLPADDGAVTTADAPAASVSA